MNIYLSILFLFVFNTHTDNTERQRSLESSSERVDSKAVIEGLRNFYKSKPYIYHELSYRLYQDMTATTPSSIESGLYIKKGESQYSLLSSLESLTTKAYTLSVDNEDKIIMISNHVAIPPSGPMVSLDHWIDPKSTLSVKSISDRWNALLIVMPEGEVEEAIITYDLKTFQPVKIVLNYRRSIQLTSDENSPNVQPRLEIEYVKTSFEEQEAERLVMSTYVYGSGDHWRLTSRYNGYELITNIHELTDQD